MQLRLACRDRACNDDASAVLFLQRRRYRTDGAEYGAEIRRDHPVPKLGVQVLDRSFFVARMIAEKEARTARDPCIGKYDIDPAEGGVGRSDGGIEIGRAGHIGDFAVDV